MSHTSPASYLVWALISSLLLGFLVFHLWSFDRFKCLKWNNGPYSGAFKRVMTYSYLMSVPLIVTYAVGFSVIKYREGFVQLPTFGVIPKPYFLWGSVERAAIFPLQLTFSVGWSLEMVTHLEELCFWLFLVNSSSAQQDWFRSLYFRTWVVGSLVAIIYMPLVTIFTRSDPLRSEAFTFLAGSLGSLSLTLWFTPVLWTFPSFLSSLKRDGVETPTIVRLTKFHELNTIRVVFRFLMVAPLVILGVDGVRSHHHINGNMFWTDFLTILAGFGCAVSSGITLVIFFPRSIEGEISAKSAARERKRARTTGFSTSMVETQQRSNHSQSIIGSHVDLPSNAYLAATPPKHPASLPSHDGHTYETAAAEVTTSPFSISKTWEEDEDEHYTSMPPIRPNRRRGEDVELGGIDNLTESNLSKHNLANVNPAIHNFTSPINFVYASANPDPEDARNESRLTFTRRR